MLEALLRSLQRWSYGDARALRIQRTTIQIRNGAVETISESSSEGIAIRAFFNGCWALASSNRIAEWRSLVRHLRPSISGKLQLSQPQCHTRSIKQKKPRLLSREELLKVLLDLEKEARKLCNKSQLTFTQRTVEKIFVNSLGAEIRQSETQTSAAITTYVLDKGRVFSASRQVVLRLGCEALDSFEHCVEAAAKIARMLPNARRAPRGFAKVALAPQAGGVLVHELIGHACEGDAIANNSSCLANNFGQSIASEQVTICDNPALNPKLAGSYAFDDEGTTASKTFLIRKGVLCGALTSLDCALPMGQRLTGSARAQGLALPMPRMSNTYLLPGDAKREEVLEDSSLLISYPVGGEVSTLTGEFTFYCEHGYLLNRGEEASMVRDFTLAGNIFDVLASIDCVERVLRVEDFEGGLCGKHGQLVPVSHSAPHIRLRARIA